MLTSTIESRVPTASIQDEKVRLGLTQFVGESTALLAEIQRIPLTASCDASVMITGETGTGKEICARLIHRLSTRGGHPFEAVNCGAIPLDLLENELFGHAAGAFTSATKAAVGLIQQADGGTLFLDEIDALPLAAQVKLLRFLEEHEFRLLGSTKTCRVDIRVITATNVNMDEAIRAGRFRQDLFYRLSVLLVSLPPLRSRGGDVALLALHFQAMYAIKFHRSSKDFSPTAMKKLSDYDWPGNVRELEHVIERAVALSEQDSIEIRDIELHRSASKAIGETFRIQKARTLQEFEENCVNDYLNLHGGNITRAAAALGLAPRVLRRLIRKHAIDLSAHKRRGAE